MREWQWHNKSELEEREKWRPMRTTPHKQEWHEKLLMQREREREGERKRVAKGVPRELHDEMQWQPVLPTMKAQDIRHKIERDRQGGGGQGEMKIIRLSQQSKERDREVTQRPVGSFNQSVVKQRLALMRLPFQ